VLPTKIYTCRSLDMNRCTYSVEISTLHDPILHICYEIYDIHKFYRKHGNTSNIVNGIKY